ncbi:MAG TPA: BBP7 family outer membrane beta-barrel protein [Pyrinomonadaceae bacterium]|nr:BBP7 family outer membrane beta-barrel protein [Pyrinomonadaceae bacterium]
MKKGFATILLIFAFTPIAFCQISGQPPLIRIESLPVPDTLPKEMQPTVKRASASLKEIDSQKSQSVNRQKEESTGRAWVSAEYLLWKMRGSDLPPLITVNQSSNGPAIIGQPGTVIAFGGRRLDQGMFPGARVTVGLWLNQRKTVGSEVSYFFMKKKSFRFQASSSGLPGSLTISRPYLIGFIDAPNGFESAYPVATPPGVPPFEVFGGTGIGTFSNRLQGAEGSILYRLSTMQCCRMTLLTGFRYLDLNEALTVTGIQDTTISGSTFRNYLTDQFNTRNQFYGGQAGLRSTLSKGRISLKLSGALALGSNRETVNINGDSFFGRGNVPIGLLAFTSNIGSYGRNQFTFIPEVRAHLGFNLTRSISPFIGYQFLYWDKVVRPGEQIDRVVDTALTGLRRPIFSFRDTRFWAQGLTTGVRVRF